MTKYAAAVLALVAALIGIIGDTHSEATGITLLGWSAIVVATLGFVATTVEIYRNRRARKRRQQKNAKTRRIANRLIVEAMQHLLVPFYVVLYEIWKNSPRGYLVDLAKSADPRYLLVALTRPEIRAELQNITLRASPDACLSRVWWESFAEHASSGSKMLNNVVEKYGAHLSSETLAALEELRADEMIGIRLPRIKDIVMANAHLPKLTLAHVLAGMNDYSALDAMVRRVVALLDLAEQRSIGALDCRLRVLVACPRQFGVLG